MGLDLERAAAVVLEGELEEAAKEVGGGGGNRELIREGYVALQVMYRGQSLVYLYPLFWNCNTTTQL